MVVGDKEFTPEIHLSVMVQGAQVESLSVLVQGYIVNPANVVHLLQIIKERIQLIEDDWAVKTQAEDFGSDSHTHTTRASLSWILQNAVFALNSLPSDAAPVLALVTDGVVDLFDAYSYDNLLMQLVRHDVHCHFLRVGGGENSPNSSFGFVPDVDLLRFIAGTTGGTVFDFYALHEACYGHARSDPLKEMTTLQEACFLRKSSVHAISTPVLKLDEMCCTSFDGRTLLPLRPYRMWREKVHEYRIFADVERIIEARIREGFTINKVHIKTCQKPVLDGNQKKLPDSPRSGESGGPGSAFREVTKILVVFLLQWKQNVWLEYVVTSTTETSASSARRFSGQGPNASGNNTSFSARKTNHFLANEQSYVGKWSEWYVKVNILAYSDFLRAFEDSTQVSTAVTPPSSVAGVGSGSPYFLHEYIRNVQDVDRVLLHLMTATAAAIAPVDASSQYSFGTSGNSSASSINSRQQNAHPVFNIIGELSPVLWHRWFYVERFELLCVVKNEACEDVFYRNEVPDVIERGRSVQHIRNKGGGIINPSRGFLHLHGGSPVYGVTIGVEKITDRLMTTLVKWSSQRLSKDLFLRFLLPSARDKNLLRNKGAGPSLPSTTTGSTTARRQQRPSTNTQNSSLSGEEAASIDGGSKSSLCFVRLEIKSKTLCAIHVAFFSTTAAARKQTLNDLKASIIAGVNDTPSTPSATSDLPASQVKSVVLSQRLISRLLVTHDTLLLHDDDDRNGGTHDHEGGPSGFQAVSSCCGGSELRLRSVFGAYMWHSSWRWHIANPAALINVMRRLHEARIGSGFWVMDWKMDDDEEGHNPQVESVVFGREILMEDENGNVKTSLVQYGLRRLSETCLVTSFWMEPQHGIVKTRLSGEVERKDKFHWGLKHAVGHDIPFEDTGFSASQDNASAGVLKNETNPVPADNATQVTQVEEERRSMEMEDVNIDWNGSAYLGENDLLQLIRGYIFKSDRHFLSCLYTFDCVVNLRASIQALSQQSKSIEGVVGSTWNADKLHAAENKQLLPPFSTARLLGTSKRCSEHFLMYLDSGTGHQNVPSAEQRIDGSPSVSLANEHLYSMLERTLRGLSDCEVSWTDFNGNEVSGEAVGQGDDDDENQLFTQGMTGQMPLWLKDHISSSFQDQVSPSALSKGKCFAKLVSDDTVVLAFLPSLDTLQVKLKGPDRFKRRSISSGSPFSESRTWLRGEPKALQESSPSIEGSSIEANTSSRLMRMSASADDIVLYQERRLSFREGYKSWRMGHYQGSRDDKQSSNQDFHNHHLTFIPEDHEFCDEVSRQAEYGRDFHLLIEREGGALGSGFFQVAFYECSIARLSTDSCDHAKPNPPSRLDLPQMILKQLFISNPTGAEDPAATPVEKGAQKKPSVRSPAGALTASVSPSPIAPETSSAIASRRFQKKVKRAHEHNFSRGVYIALREGDNVQQSDLIQALTSCIEVPIDLDITLLYRMMQASSARLGLQPFAASNQRDSLKERLDKSFEKILSSAFIPIPGTKYYYFTGSENATYDDVSDGEYELHFLMDDSDEVESSAAPDDEGTVSGSSLDESDSRSSVDGKAIHSFPRASKPPLPKSAMVPSSHGHDSHQDSLRSLKSGRRFKDHGRPPPVKTSSGDVPAEQHPGVEEDAEFNKEVAVATSIFSAPFFFRFEFREINNSRGHRENENQSPGAVSSGDILQRRAGTKSFVDMRQEWLTIHQSKLPPASSGDQQDGFEARLESLKGNKESQEDGIPQVAARFGNAPSCRVALRLITLTLPNEQAFERQHLMPFEMDDSNHGSNLVPSRAQVLSSLPLFQRQVLKQARKDIKEWCSVEVLDILRSAHKITPSISQLVQKLFEDLPPHSVTKAKYPLNFVAGSQDALGNPVELFKKELLRGSMLHVHESNGVYFVVEREAKQGRDMVPSSGEACVSSAEELRFEVPFWAFFTVATDHVSLQLHHPDRFLTRTQTFDRLGVLTRLHMGVLSACKRVNQFLLLLQLHETRTCNGLLLPASNDQPSSPRSPKRRDSGNSFGAAGSNEQFFWPGQFQCDLQYSAFFKLHERLAPTIALNMLCTSALEQFQVHNRRHIFVYRDRGGHVFYMKISIKHENAAVLESPDKKRLSRIGSGLAPGLTPMSTSGPSVAGILLEVFGVCEAGEEVTQELCRVLERKLDEATQLILMKILARNAKLQLSPSDMAFVCPPGGKPAQVIKYLLPAKLHGAAALLQFLSQTLSSAPYIRHVSNVGSSSRAQSDNPNDQGIVRGGRRHSTLGIVAKPPEEKSSVSVPPNAALIHPAWFLASEATSHAHQEMSPGTVSPIFFSSVASSSRVRSAATAKPKVVDQTAYVLNLNPELRLSPGFLSRIGRGLAVVRFDLLQNEASNVPQADQEEDGHIVKSLEGFDEVSTFVSDTSDTSTIGAHYVVRCQLWIRGSINTSELGHLLESNLREAMLDYQIESTLKLLSVDPKGRQGRASGADSKHLPQEVLYLSSLFERSCLLSSASVTKLVLPTSVAPWDIEHVVSQFRSILRCVPSYLRPAIYSKRKAVDEYTAHRSDNVATRTHEQPHWKDPDHRQYFRMVARLEVDPSESSSDSEASSANPQSNSVRNVPLGHSESIQSDMSELDSASNKLSLTWTSMSGSDSNMNALIQSSSSSPAPVSQSLYSSKEFSESELLLYPNTSAHGSTSGSGFEGVFATSHEGGSSANRSFYYVIDVSSTDGMQFYGYNMSSAVVDTLMIHFARILTWSKLREKLLCNLLLEKSGLSRVAPLGSNVVHPRELYANGGGNAMGKSSIALPKDSCVHFVEFWRPAMTILTESTVLPRLLDANLLRSIEGSSLGKYLREAHTLASDRGEGHRPRAISNVSLQGGVGGGSGPPELHRDGSSHSSSQWSTRSETAGPLKNMAAIGRGGSSSAAKSDRTVPSPTKRGISGGAGMYPGGNGSSAAAANPRVRGHTGAANALLAARARARGALPGRLGGAGGSTKPAASGDSVAPWDLPLTNTKGPVLTGSGAPESLGAPGSTSAPAAVADPSGKALQVTERQRLPNDAGGDRPSTKSNNLSLRDLSLPSSPVNTFGSSQGRQSSATSNDVAGLSSSWRKQLEFAWGPRYKFRDSYAPTSSDASSTTPDESADICTESKQERDMRKNPLHHFSAAFQTRWQDYESRSTSHTICLNLFDKLATMKPGEEMDEAVSLSIVDRMMQSGHQLLHQRFRVTFVERWEVVKVDEEYVEEDMQDGRLRALQASMDLVNLLSYKKEFVFTGNECTIANFYTEHTVLGMCANEGDAVREMKKQIMKNIFHLKMEVAHDFYEQYAVHLRSLGFRHLRTLSPQHGLRSAPLPTPSSSTSLSSLSAVDLVASDGEGFSEYFYYSGRSHGKMKGWNTHSRGSSAFASSLLLLELKCDHHGVRLGVVLIDENDLQQQDLAFQNRLVPSRVSQSEGEKKVVSGEMIKSVSSWLRETLRTRAIIYGFTIRFFQRYLAKWSNDQQERSQASADPDVFALSSASQSLPGNNVQSFQNIVKGIRCFLHSYPEPPATSSPVKLSSDRAQRGNIVAQQTRDSLLRTAVVELPPTQLHSNCSESILVKILLRYIACHGARYEVLDLMQFGTPDAVVCHSPSGSFFHRQASTGQKPFGHVPSPTNFNGYSLLITTQSLVDGFGLQAQDKKRRKNCIQLILLKSSPPSSLGVGNGVLPVERALVEAEYFVQELFRVAAQHYERDLLWSRLLYDDTTGPGAKVASTLALPPNHFEVEVGPQQLEECLRLSVCTPLEEIDPTLAQLMSVEGVCWQEFALRLRDLYSDQLREYRFEGEDACHFLLLCPNTHDLIIHLTFENEQEPLLDFSLSGVSGVSINGNGGGNNGKVKIEICRREEPPNRTFTFAQRRVITDFVNSVVHWQWRSLLYD